MAKGEASEWEKKCKDQAGVFEQEKKTLEENTTRKRPASGAPVLPTNDALHVLLKNCRPWRRTLLGKDLEWMSL